MNTRGLRICIKRRTMAVMQHTEREQAILRRLWELQADAGLSDAALARRLGVAQSNISRAKRCLNQSVSVKFLLGACSAFPALAFVVFPELQINTDNVHDCTDKGAA